MQVTGQIRAHPVKERERESIGEREALIVNILRQGKQDCHGEPHSGWPLFWR